MSLNESIVEDAALEWFLLRPALRDYGGQVGEQSRDARTLTRPLPQGEEKREAIRRLNPANASGTPHPGLLPGGEGVGLEGG